MEKIVFTCMESKKVASLLEGVRGIEGVFEDINVVEVYVDELKLPLLKVYNIILDSIAKYSDGKGTIYFNRINQFKVLKDVKELSGLTDIHIMSSVG